MHTDRILEFLKNIKENNNRPYFNAHKDEYQAAHADLEQIVEYLIKEIGVVDASVAMLTPKECIYRIYRDIRFSPDKAPYKRHMAAFIAPQGGHRSLLSGYYLHLQPGESLLAVGTYGLSKEQIARMRSTIYGCYDEFRAVIDIPEFKDSFTDVYSMSTTLKKVPKDYPEDFEGARYLKLKDYIVSKPFSDEEVLSPGFAEQVAHLCKIAVPFNMFVNEVLTERD